MNTSLIEELEPGWTVHTAPTGHRYYYNAETKKSTYKKPAKSSHDAISHNTQVPISSPTTASTKSKHIPEVSTVPELLAVEQSEDPVKQVLPDTAGSGGLHNLVHDGVPTIETKKDRPKRKEAIPIAIPWVRVYTKLNRVFYHNLTTNESCWVVPEDIAPEVARWTKERHHQEEVIGDEYLAHSDSSYLEEEEEDERQENEDTQLEEYNEDDIAWQLAAMENEGQGAFDQGDEPEYSYEEKDAIFTRMLVDHNLDPFSTWEAEISKIASDPRYLVFDTTHQRKSSFERYCVTRAAEVQALKASERKIDSRIPFLRMVKEALHHGMYFQDFKRKSKKEPAYRAYGNSDHDRERLYRVLQDKYKLSQAQKEAEFIDLISTTSAESKEVDARFYLLDSERMADLIAKFGQP